MAKASESVPIANPESDLNPSPTWSRVPSPLCLLPITPPQQTPPRIPRTSGTRRHSTDGVTAAAADGAHARRRGGSREHGWARPPHGHLQGRRAPRRRARLRQHAPPRRRCRRLWRRFCAEDLGLDAPVDPWGRPLPSFQVAYKVWLESFGMYPLPLVKRVKEFWNSMKIWLSENFPEAAQTLSKGVLEAELKSAEDLLGFKLPMPTKLLYRFCNAQLPFNQFDEETELMTRGIIGGYEFNGHLVNVHLAPLHQIIVETADLYYDHPDDFHGRELIVVATSWFHPKIFLLNCSNGQLYVGRNNLIIGEMLPCVPRALIKLTDNDMPQDGLLLWLEEHLRRLQNGMIKTRMWNKSKYISLYPEGPPSCTSAVTHGVEVRASGVFVPEYPQSLAPERSCMYTYSIRTSVPEACMRDGVYYSSCQLYSCHWTIRSRDIVVSEEGAEGVIGQYPALSPGQDEFVYESCTALPEGPGSVEGSFLFVPGKLSHVGEPFEVTVAPFPLEVPEYIF